MWFLYMFLTNNSVILLAVFIIEETQYVAEGSKSYITK